MLKLHHLVPNCISVLSWWAPGWLLLGSDGRVNIETVTDEGWINSWSIVSVLCKYVNISFEKLNQLFLLLRGQLSPYLKELLWGTTNDHLL